jgi:predicted ATPase
MTARLYIEETMEGAATNKYEHLRFKGIMDLERKIVVPLSETGTGFSQLLPIVLAAFSGNGELVTIQQPELHLHPALQSELADLFITRALGKRFDEMRWDGTNQFVLETHSEHLLLRIMRRIRETSRGVVNEIPPVYADDISVLYIDNAGDHAVVRPMPLSEDGQLLYDWPEGFFEEGLREVLM